MKAKIVNSLNVFSAYDEWAEYYGYRIDFGFVPEEGEEYEVVCHGKHFESFELYTNHLLYGLIRPNGRIIIMLDKGIELKKTDENGNYFLGLI